MQTTSKKEFNCSYLDEISLNGLFLRAKVPHYQKTIANNYMTIKKIFSYTFVQPRVTNVEYSKLKSAGFSSLELANEETIYNELMKILEWANSNNQKMVNLAKELFEIRVKELKYIFANTSSARLFELNKGYIVLDKYLQFIAG